MSEKNKRFRSHCDFDVMIDRENNCVEVSVEYKPELLTSPLCWQRHKYGSADVCEELERQGIQVGLATSGGGTMLDNTTINSRHKYTAGVYCFSMKAKKPAPKPTPVDESPQPEAPDPKRKTRSKTKTTKN